MTGRLHSGYSQAFFSWGRNWFEAAGSLDSDESLVQRMLLPVLLSQEAARALHYDDQCINHAMTRGLGCHVAFWFGETWEKQESWTELWPGLFWASPADRDLSGTVQTVEKTPVPEELVNKAGSSWDWNQLGAISKSLPEESKQLTSPKSCSAWQLHRPLAFQKKSKIISVI